MSSVVVVVDVLEDEEETHGDVVVTVTVTTSCASIGTIDIMAVVVVVAPKDGICTVFVIVIVVVDAEFESLPSTAMTEYDALLLLRLLRCDSCSCSAIGRALISGKNEAIVAARSKREGVSSIAVILRVFLE